MEMTDQEASSRQLPLVIHVGVSSPFPLTPRRQQSHRAMEDASSDFSDWEVLSAASEAGGDDEDVVLVSGQGGDVLYDHFALDTSSAAAEGSSSSEAASEEVESEFRSVDRFDSISPEPPMDLTAVVDSTAQLQLQFGGADVTAHGSVPGASSAYGGATWTARDEEPEEALAAEEIEAARSRGEPESVPAHQGPEGILVSDATAAADGLGLQTENSIAQLEDSSAQLEEDGGADSATQSSGFAASAATGDDEVRAAPVEEEPEQGKDAAPGCGESDGDGKDCSPPLAAAAAPVTGEGAERQLIVWWRLPFKLIHYCAWKVRPVWSLSIAAAFLGIVVLGRRMYRMRRKTPGLPQIKIALDDKRASQFADRAACLNEAFLIAKRVPALRTSSGAALPWSMMQER
ncbi:hypothetical protein ACQ4PT_037153 [Festuca glaucescens]